MLQGEHSAILSTFIKLPFVIKIFVLSILEWPFYTGFTVLTLEAMLASSLNSHIWCGLPTILFCMVTTKPTSFWSFPVRVVSILVSDTARQSCGNGLQYMYPACRVKYQHLGMVFVCLLALHPKSTAMVMAGQSVHLTTLFPGQA